MFYKGEVPFVRLLIPLIIGISLGYIFPYPFILSWRVIMALPILGIFIMLLVKYKSLSLYRSAWLFGLIIHVYILLTGYGLTIYLSERYDKKHFSVQKAEAFIIQIRNEPKLSNGILRFEAKVIRSYPNKKSEITSGKLLIAAKTDSVRPLNLNYGDILLIPAIYDKVDPPFNPGEFDYRSYLKNHQIYHQAFISRDQFVLLKQNSGNRVIAFALGLRKKLVEKFYTYLPDRDAAALASTLILGYRADLSKEIVDAYSKTGTMHVLSVSGMHVGIVFLVLSVLLKPMGRNQKLRLIRAILIISIIWFYSLLTGFSAPVCRAAVMLSFVVLGKALNKSQNTYNLIATSAFFLLLYNPFYLVDAGFQLSYLAVTGLVYFHPKIYQMIFIRNKVLDQAWSYCALSLAAQLATFPISLYYFHQFPIYFLISNLFIVLPVAIIMYAGIAFLFIPFSILIKPMGQFLNWLINLTNGSLYYIENLPFSSVSGIWISSFQYLLIYLIIGCFILKISFKSKGILWFASIFLVVLAISFTFQSVINYKRHELIFFSLRKNTAIAYLYRGRSVIVSDLHASDKLISFSIKPVLESRGSTEGVFYNTDQRFLGSSYTGDENFLQFGKFRILRWNRKFDELSFTRNLKVDGILISGNPRKKLADIQTCIDFSIVLIDGTNPDYKIKAWQAEAEKLNIACYVLKKNPAYILSFSKLD